MYLFVQLRQHAAVISYLKPWGHISRQIMETVSLVLSFCNVH